MSVSLALQVAGLVAGIAWAFSKRTWSEVWQVTGQWWWLLLGSSWLGTWNVTQPRLSQQDVPALLAWDFGAEAARQISQPTLYIGGSESGPWFAAVRKLMLDWLSPSEDVVVAGADHNLVVTHPGQVARALTNFIARHPITP